MKPLRAFEMLLHSFNEWNLLNRRARTDYANHAHDPWQLVGECPCDRCQERRDYMAAWMRNKRSK